MTFENNKGKNKDQNKSQQNCNDVLMHKSFDFTVSNSESFHKPVMLEEVINYLNPKEGESYIDCTFGAGGYTRAILESCNCNVLAIDQDIEVVKFAEKTEERYGKRFTFLNKNFSDINEIAEDKNNENSYGLFDGIVFDLGVSSMQLDEASRGFSFRLESKLDMRMSQNTKTTAYDVVNFMSESELSDIIYYNGEEVKAKKIAKYIVEQRKIKKIETTLELANIVYRVIPKRFYQKIDPATKTFQAIRIYLNDELTNLKIALKFAHKLLKKGGRIIIVSFHSLEDRIVKDHLKLLSEPKISVSKYKKNETENDESDNRFVYKILTKKPLTPSEEEINKNQRSRSAKMRVAIRI